VKTPETDPILDPFLNGSDRADTWREYKETLAVRLKALIAERDAATNTLQRAALDKKVTEMKEQVRVLAEEEAITRFVEESVYATISRDHPLEANANTDRPMTHDLGADDDGGPY
jgi:hypothetical protein